MIGAVAKIPLRSAGDGRQKTPRALCLHAAGCILAIALALVPNLSAATPVRFAGAMGGIVTDSGGKPQPGALVLLLNRQDRILQRIKTDSLRTFPFSELVPELYSG